MNRKYALLTIITALSMSFVTAQTPQSKITVQYPNTKKGETVDDYFGTKVSDPYRWLEDDKSSETAEWVSSQNETTQNYLSKIPFRNEIKDRLTELWNYQKATAPFREGGHLLFYQNNGLQNQNILFEEIGNNKFKEVLDPNKLSADGTVSLGSVKASADGRYLAYTISKSGSDWNEIHVRDLKKDKELEDVIKWVKFSSISWSGKGFYYSCYDEPKQGSELSNKNEFHKVYFHKIGDDQKKDELIYEDKEAPQRNFSAEVTDDGHYLIISVTESTSGNALYVKNLRGNDSKFVMVAKGFENDWDVIGTLHDSLLVRTNYDASDYQLMVISPNSYDPGSWRTFFRAKDAVIETALMAGDKIIIKKMMAATDYLEVIDLKGNRETKIQLPDLGSVGALNGKPKDDLLFFSFTSFTTPSSTFEYRISEGLLKPRFTPALKFDPSQFETNQVYYEGLDGTKIPMFLVHKKGLKMDGYNPTLLYGYGGFNISVTPAFNPARIAFLENGGILAIPSIRGGGEFGEDWHRAGIKEKKQTVFNDFIAAAQYLITKNYTNPQKLAIQGGSNGGLLVGACMTQKPELFKVALPQVGVMDMLRFHKFTIGWAWKSDYGSSETPEGFAYLYRYSPLHNIKENVCYPATLVTTADHDDRVVPAHSFKFIATLQAKQKCDNPTLIRIETKAGHGGGKPVSKSIEEAADVYAFTFYHLGITPKFEKKAASENTETKVKTKPVIRDPYIKANMPAASPKEPGNPSEPPKK